MIFRSFGRIAALVAAACLTLPAFASDNLAAHFTYVGLGGINQQADLEAGSTFDGNGGFAEASFAFPFHMYLHARGESARDGDLDSDRYDAGVGTFLGLSESVIGYAEAAFVRYDGAVFSGAEADGARVGVGLDIRALPEMRIGFEGGALLDVVDSGDYFRAYLDAGIGEGFSLFAEYRISRVTDVNDTEADLKDALIGIRFDGFGYGHE